jgi:Spy/CpxP family protein refolding chaperone
VNSWKVILATVIIFGAGVVTGGLLVGYVVHPKINPPFANSNEHAQADGHEQLHPRPPEMWSKEFVQKLDDALKLTPEQRDAIEKIIADGQEKNHEIWTNITPQIRKVMQDARQQIREQLTPDQRKKFEELLKQFRLQHRPPSTNSPPTIAPTNAPGV